MNSFIEKIPHAHKRNIRYAFEQSIEKHKDYIRKFCTRPDGSLSFQGEMMTKEVEGYKRTREYLFS